MTKDTIAAKIDNFLIFVLLSLRKVLVAKGARDLSPRQNHPNAKTSVVYFIDRFAVKRKKLGLGSVQELLECAGEFSELRKGEIYDQVAGAALPLGKGETDKERKVSRGHLLTAHDSRRTAKSFTIADIKRQGPSRLLKKAASCFESLMLRQAQQNGIFFIHFKFFAFVLRSSKDSERVFQQPARTRLGES
jgi:hypothetical protein